MKMCKKCRTPKLLSEYGLSKQFSDGLSCYCRSCYNEICRSYYEKNKEKVKEAHRLYYKKNKEKLKPTRKAYYLNNKEDYLKKQKLYLSIPKNRRNRNETASIRDRDRRQKDINYKLKRNLRTRIWNSLKGLYKTQKTENLIGCQIEELKAHLSSKWDSGMTWENYGEWHVDHVKPCASFDLSKPEEQQKCFHYSNLQPLWARDNLLKNAKLIEPFFNPVS